MEQKRRRKTKMAIMRVTKTIKMHITKIELTIDLFNTLRGGYYRDVTYLLRFRFKTL